MSNPKYRPLRGHEPLRVPHGWTDQSRQLVVQLEHLLDEIYNQLQKSEDRLRKLEDRVSALEEE